MSLTFDDLVRIARASLPGEVLAAPVAQGGQLGASVVVDGATHDLAWLWRERVHPKKPKVPNPRVVAVPVKDEVEKALLIEGDPRVYFTEPHYDGFPAVLVRLDAVTEPELTRLLFAASRLPPKRSPKKQPTKTLTKTLTKKVATKAPASKARPRRA